MKESTQKTQDVTTDTRQRQEWKSKVSLIDQVIACASEIMAECLWGYCQFQIPMFKISFFSY